MKKIIRHGLAAIMALALCMSLLPMSVFAAEAGDTCPYCGGSLVPDKATGALICDSCTDFENGVIVNPEPAEPDEPKCEHKNIDPDSGACKDCGMNKAEINTPEPVEPDEPKCEHKNIDPDSGACKDCGMSKAEMNTPEPVEPQEPQEHVHTWTNYAANHWEPFTHYKTCSVCGETVKESCHTEVVLQSGEYVKKCTLCNYWQLTAPPQCQHTQTHAFDNGDGTHILVCADTNCLEMVGVEAHKFSNGECVCGAKEPVYVPIDPPVSLEPAEDGSYGHCICGASLVLKDGYIVCSESCTQWKPQPGYKPELGNDGKPTGTGEIWCSRCSDYAQPVACGGWVCYTGNTTNIEHIVKVGTNCVDLHVHDHQCDYCHAEMVTRDWVTVAEPTCLEPGLKELWCTYEWCTVDQVPAETMEIAALGHDFENQPWDNGELVANAAAGTYTGRDGNEFEFDPDVARLYKYTRSCVRNDAIETAYAQVAKGTLVVRWVNWDGTELESGAFYEGQEAPAAGAYSGATPTRPSDGTYNYSFSGWSAPAISGDGTIITYTAEFNPTRIILPPEPEQPEPEPEQPEPEQPEPEPEQPVEIEIEEPDTPLVELPEEIEIEEPDTPLAELPEEIEIEEPETPLVELPEEIELEDPDVPLADVPQTGDYSFIWEVFALISGAALVWLVLDDRKRRTAE